MIDWKTLFTSPAGRIKRQAYWIGWICQFAASFLLSLALRPISIYAGVAVGVLLLYPAYCIYAKRLQDMGKPGTLAAIPMGLGFLSLMLNLYMVVGLGIKPGANPFSVDPAAAAANMGTLMALGLGSLVIGLICLVFWLVLGIANGQEGPNRYGPEPGADEDEVFE